MARILIRDARIVSMHARLGALPLGGVSIDGHHIAAKAAGKVAAHRRPPGSKRFPKVRRTGLRRRHCLGLGERGVRAPLNGVQQLGRVLIPPGGILDKSPVHNRTPPAAQLAGGLGRFVHDGVKQRGSAVAVKGKPSGEHFIQHHAQRPQIAAPIRRLPLGLLGRHIGSRAGHLSAASLRLLFQKLG